MLNALVQMMDTVFTTDQDDKPLERPWDPREFFAMGGGFTGEFDAEYDGLCLFTEFIGYASAASTDEVLEQVKILQDHFEVTSETIAPNPNGYGNQISMLVRRRVHPEQRALDTWAMLETEEA